MRYDYEDDPFGFDPHLDVRVAECPMCEAQSTEFGSLGSTVHFKCRDCGWVFPKTIEEQSYVQ